jgi:hypothetical protein
MTWRLQRLQERVMFEQIQLVFFNFLQYKRAQPEQTRNLALLKHNDDLCPLVQERCEDILHCVERHRSLVYDMQGPGDAGIDVLTKLSYNESDKYIGLQVKSDIEVSKELLKTLKAQYFDAKNRLGEQLVDYYILLAWNAKERAATIRSVAQTFGTMRNVHVIEPAFLWTFLYGLTELQIEALVTAYLSEGDPLIRKARTSVATLSPSQVCILIALLEAHTNSDKPAPTLADLRNSPFLQRMYQRSSGLRYYNLEVSAGTELPHWLNEPIGVEDIWTRLAEDLDSIELWIDPAFSDRYSLDTSEAEVLLALAYEGKARYGHSDDQLCEFLFELLNAHSRSDRDRDALAEAQDLAVAVYQSGLPWGKSTSTLSELLQLNCPQLADVERFKLPSSVYSEGSVDWRKLARRLLSRARTL